GIVAEHLLVRDREILEPGGHFVHQQAGALLVDGQRVGGGQLLIGQGGQVHLVFGVVGDGHAEIFLAIAAPLGLEIGVIHLDAAGVGVAHRHVGHQEHAALRGGGPGELGAGIGAVHRVVEKVGLHGVAQAAFAVAVLAADGLAGVAFSGGLAGVALSGGLVGAAVSGAAVSGAS